MCDIKHALFLQALVSHLNLGGRCFPLAMRCSEDDPWCDQNSAAAPPGLVVPVVPVCVKKILRMVGTVSNEVGMK